MCTFLMCCTYTYAKGVPTFYHCFLYYHKLLYYNKLFIFYQYNRTSTTLYHEGTKAPFGSVEEKEPSRLYQFDTTGP